VGTRLPAEDIDRITAAIVAAASTMSTMTAS